MTMHELWEEFPDRESQCLGDADNHAQGGIPLTSLNTPDVGAVNANHIGKPFLGITLFFPERPHPEPKLYA